MFPGTDVTASFDSVNMMGFLLSVVSSFKIGSLVAETAAPKPQPAPKPIPALSSKLRSPDLSLLLLCPLQLPNRSLFLWLSNFSPLPNLSPPQLLSRNLHLEPR